MNQTSKANLIWTVIFMVLAVMITPDLRQTATNSTFVSQDITQTSIETAAAKAEGEVDLYKLSPEELNTYSRSEVTEFLAVKQENVIDAIEPVTESSPEYEQTAIETISFEVEAVTEFEPEAQPEPEPESEWVSMGEYTLTGYCPCVKCCGIWSEDHPSRIGTDYVQKTMSGTIPEAGRTVGANPSVLPFGTVLLINDVEYIVEDTGGAVRSKPIIDVFCESHEEAVEFGRQKAEIYIKK